MNSKDIGDEWVVANDAHNRFGVDRSWLREKSGQGQIRKRTLEWNNGNGEARVKYLYNVLDIREALRASQG